MPQKTLRTFLALEIEDKVKQVIVTIQDKVKSSNSIKGSWVDKDNLHLTLKFLGDIKLDEVERIIEILNKNFKDEISINCGINKIGVFPDSRFPRILWIGTENDSGKIKELFDKLEDCLSNLGFKKEEREFKTHITISRIKQVFNRDKLDQLINDTNSNFTPIPSKITKLTFFESKLSSKGPTYIPLATQNLT